MHKPTEQEKHAVEQIFGSTVWDDIEEANKQYYETGLVGLRCTCGKTEHFEYMVDGIPTIICSDCGEVYYTASSIQEIENKRK